MLTDLSITITAVMNGLTVRVQGGPDSTDPFGEMEGRWVADDLEQVWDSLPGWVKELEARREQSLEQQGHRRKG